VGKTISGGEETALGKSRIGGGQKQKLPCKKLSDSAQPSASIRHTSRAAEKKFNGNGVGDQVLPACSGKKGYIKARQSADKLGFYTTGRVVLGREIQGVRKDDLRGASDDKSMARSH